ncbi:MAG: MaoC/PaaZ C-terminal domain-containing protein [Porticoccaceae bacterium]
MINKYTCFEDYEAGQSGVTRMRTIGDPEIVSFAGITCDYSFLHLAAHQAEQTFYGGRIAHGLLGCSMAMGLLSLDAGHTVGRSVPGSYLSGFNINYRSAIYSGDTVRVEWNLVKKPPVNVSNGFGTIETHFKIINYKNEPVYDGVFRVNVKLRAASDDAMFSEPSSSTLWQPAEIPFDAVKDYNIRDFVVGTGGVTSGRTMTEADIVNFSGLTGDYNPIYVDEVYASSRGGRIVPPMLVFDWALGFWARDSWYARAKTDNTAQDIGHLGDNSIFLRPVRIGDTVHCIYQIKSVRVTKNNKEKHVVIYGLQIVNQRNEVVQEGEILVVKGNVGEYR